MSDEMIYRDGVGYIPYHAHVRLMVVKYEQLATLRATNERLRAENIQMKFALGYPMPADLERYVLPSNPFKCGVCDAKRDVHARIEHLEAALAARPIKPRHHPEKLRKLTGEDGYHKGWQEALTALGNARAALAEEALCPSS